MKLEELNKIIETIFLAFFKGAAGGIIFIILCQIMYILVKVIQYLDKIIK